MISTPHDSDRFQKGWGEFSAAECLQEQTITWQSIWKGGELVVAQGRKRLYWEFSNRSPSGVTGITGTGVTVSDPALDELAIRCIKSIDSSPDGIFGVAGVDKHGMPNLTEINSGRFFTTHQFFTAAGLNAPLIFEESAFSEQVNIPKRIYLLPDGLVWIRADQYRLPRLSTVADSRGRTGGVERARGTLRKCKLIGFRPRLHADRRRNPLLQDPLTWSGRRADAQIPGTGGETRQDTRDGDRVGLRFE